MSRRSRLALIGAGIMGRHHLSVALADPAFEVVAIADSAAPLDSYRRQGIAVFDDHRRMLEAVRPDCAVIATPNAFHVPAAIDCVERGVAALVEKPVGDGITAAQRLSAAVAASGVPVLVGHHRRHNPLLRTAARHIADGGIGRLVAAAGLWIRRKPDAYFREAWKTRRDSGGGVLLINTIHDIDCLRMLCGEIESVQALTSNAMRGNEVEDSAAIALRFENGALGTITVSDAAVAPWCWEMTSREDPRFAHVPENAYLLSGTRGSLALPTLEAWSNAPDGGRDAAFTRQRLYYVAADSMTEQMAHFARVVRREEPPLVSVEDAARTLAATLAITRSAALGRVVGLAEMLAG